MAYFALFLNFSTEVTLSEKSVSAGVIPLKGE